MPTLVYEVEYPRNDTIRYGFIIRKFIYGFMNVVAAYIIASDYIIPTIEENLSLTTFEIVIRLIVPTVILTILLFYIIFEITLNFFG